MFVNSENLCFTTILNIRLFAVQFQRYSSTIQHRTPARGCARIRNFRQMVFQHLLDVFLVSTFVPHVARKTERCRIIIRHIRRITFRNHLNECLLKPSLFSSPSSRYSRIMEDRRPKQWDSIILKFADTGFEDQLLHLFLFRNESSLFSCGGIPE